MTKNDYVSYVSSIVKSEQGFGFQAYACIKKEGHISHSKLILEDSDRDSFKYKIGENIRNCIIEKYIPNEFDYKQINDVHDNTISLYEIQQNDDYNPFDFINTDIDCDFTDNDKQYLFGYLFSYNVDNKTLWAYQQAYAVTIPQKKKGTFIYSKNEIFREFKKELYRIDYRVDLLIINKSIITSNLGLLQSKFGFETFIRNESKKTIDIITQMDIVDNIEKIISYEGKEKLTNAKKLMKIRKSPVLSMDKNVLIDRLKQLPIYRNKVSFEGDKIILRTNKDVDELLKVLNDDYLRSELTDSSYESSSKTLQTNA